MAKHQQNTPAPAPRGQGDQHPGDLVAVQTTEYSGPLPHPELLARYDQIHPGTAERILLRFEKEADHRQSLEQKITDAQIAQQQSESTTARHGQLFAFILGMTGLLVGGAAAIFAPSPAHAIAGASIGGLSLATLVGVFIYGRKVKPPADAEPSTDKQ